MVAVPITVALNRLFSRLVLLITSFLGGTVCWADDADMVLKSRVHDLSNFSATFRECVTYSPDVEFVKKTFGTADAASLLTGEFDYDCSFSLDTPNCARFSRTLDRHTIDRFKGSEVPEVRRYDVVYSADRVETLTQQCTGDLTGLICDRQPLPNNTWFEVAIGLRPFGSDGWMDAASLQKHVTVKQPDGNVIETWQGLDGCAHKWRFGPGKQPPLLSYSVLLPDSRPFYNVACSEFVTIGDDSLPKRIKVDRYSYASKVPKVISTISIEVLSMTIGDPANKPSSYAMIWPKGTKVFDSRVQEGFNVLSGDRMLSDRDIFALLSARTRRGAATLPATVPLQGD